MKIGRLSMCWVDSIEFCFICPWTTPPDGRTDFPYREYCLRIGHLLVVYILPLRETRSNS